MPAFSSQSHHAGPPRPEPIHSPSRPPGFGSRSPGYRTDRPMGSRPSFGRRMFRTFLRFAIMVLIGVGATLGWQSYGDEATVMLRTQAPSLGWLLPDPSTGSSSATSAPPELVQQQQQQQIGPMARDLAAVRRIVEQLAVTQSQFAAQQDQMAQNILALQASEQDIQQKMSPPTRPARAAPHKPAPGTRQTSAAR